MSSKAIFDGSSILIELKYLLEECVAKPIRALTGVAFLVHP